MRSYTQLAQEQRYQIYALKKAGHSQAVIAEVLGFHKSTISRELKRNRGRKGYRPQQAQQFAQQRQRDKPRSRIPLEAWTTVERLLRLQWSPGQISGWLAKTRRASISHEWIYQHVYSDKVAGGDLHIHLRCQKKRRKRYGTKSIRGQIVDRQSIEDRPDLVESRSRIGDWEVDTIIGKGHQQAIVSLTERKARLALLAKVEQKTADQVTRAIVRLLEPHSDKVLTLTSDNGKEFAKHREITEQLSADFYFAHPYSSWERGTNENMNGLVRQYFPKNCELKNVTDKEIQIVMHRLNNRPRKCLGYLTPNEVFFGESTVALVS
jgi:IS30 family transposase